MTAQCGYSGVVKVEPQTASIHSSAVHTHNYLTEWPLKDPKSPTGLMPIVATRQERWTEKMLRRRSQS